MSAIALTVAASPSAAAATAASHEGGRGEEEDHDARVPLSSSSPASFQQQQQQQQQPQQVIVIHKLGCPKINWTPVAICAFVLIIFCMVTVFLLATINFGAHDRVYKLRGGNYLAYVVQQYCPSMPDATGVARRRDIEYVGAKAACTLPDDTVVCYTISAADGCVAAAYIVWPWLLSLLLMLFTLTALCVICFVWTCRPTHLTDTNMRRCFG